MSGGVSPEMFTLLVAFGMFVVLYILFHLLSIITRTCVWCKEL
nr:MAG TPA: K epoxide reductase family protein [Caudoviricetes sp.]